MDTADTLTCPFCGFKDQGDYQMLLHVEIYHSEDGESPFAVRDAIEAGGNSQREATSDHDSQSALAPNSDYVDCPYKCGEQIPSTELQFHSDFHLAEEMALEEATSEAEDLPASEGHDDDDPVVGHAIHDNFDSNIHTALRNFDSTSSLKASSRNHPQQSQRRTPSLKELFFGSPSKAVSNPKSTDFESTAPKRLGTTELGPYAHEKRMPSWLQRMLQDGAKVTIYNKIGPGGTLVRTEEVANETRNLVLVLARLSLLDQRVARAFYCAPEVRHVAKMKDEGGFCGYRNIQMLISYIYGAQSLGHQHFSKRLPSVIKLQDMIERAWDKGYNSNARAETGGIWLTRKYIGTSEAQALLQSLEIPCEVAAFFSTSQSEAHLNLLQALFDYFDDQSDDTHKIVVTDRPPIYFQHKGHSMTIVGVEVQRNGNANLVVFDPMFNPSGGVKKLLDRPNFRCENPAALLKAHRRGESYLSRYKTYEILKMTNAAHEP